MSLLHDGIMATLRVHSFENFVRYSMRRRFFFETTLEQVRGCEDPHKEYNLVCDGIFSDGWVNMGRLCALFAFSIVLVKVFPNIQELLVAQLKKRQVEIEKLKKWE